MTSPLPCVQLSPASTNTWTDPILCEETRARLVHFRSLGWLPPYFKPRTLAGIAVIERYWRKETAQKEYFQNAPVLEVDKQIKQLLGLSDFEDSDVDNSSDEDWELPIPEYVFSERARLVENFYGSEAENFDEDQLLARRI
ncbi:hypothetical protein N7474_001588 [Penicillium riverlandense]|uniref:uncharacterized protein n=1 Tax=Penicillium riverlandense TaxID=1903569 RepID=UPI00254766A5|nr:uncharacterized protein N7474_001588 [Penicillium riverlandense]KAJ5833277.1 hypothetical protein N7474_001588 [Penicillium riverlandense]